MYEDPAIGGMTVIYPFDCHWSFEKHAEYRQFSLIPHHRAATTALGDAELVASIGWMMHHFPFSNRRSPYRDVSTPQCYGLCSFPRYY